MTRIPAMAAPELTFNPNDTITEVRTYEVITPLFGGGVEPGQPDPISVVRASEVRGQLRFWWRATRGGQFNGSLEDMRKAELALWGGAATFDKQGKPETGQSLVQVVVEPIQCGHEITQYQARNGNRNHLGSPGSPISYGAFALRETSDGKQASKKVLYVGVTFDLTITFPINSAPDVRAALWAWETFGGLGARTRRGFGAIKLVKRTSSDGETALNQPKDSASVQNWLEDNGTTHIAGTTWPTAVPYLQVAGHSKVKPLPRGFSVRNEQFSDLVRNIFDTNRLKVAEFEHLVPAFTAWYYPIQKLQEFRQKRRNNFKRSYWPEPDEIRRRTTGFRGKHDQEVSSVRKFPRAVFGLPIIFKFKDEDVDPAPTTLQGAEHDRMASRLILRPIACADGSYVAAATLLNGPQLPPNGLKLKGATHDDEIAVELSKTEATFSPLNGNPDVLQAFLDTL